MKERPPVPETEKHSKRKYYGCRNCWDEKAHKKYEEKRSEMEDAIEAIIELMDQKFTIKEGKDILEKAQKRLEASTPIRVTDQSFCEQCNHPGTYPVHQK